MRWVEIYSSARHSTFWSFGEFPHVMPRCTAAMGILGGESKKCCLVEDSLRHLRCRGMTSQSFPLEMPILAALSGMTKKRKFLQARKTIRIDEFSEKGQADKFPLKNGDLFT